MKILWLTCLLFGIFFLGMQLFWTNPEAKGDGFVVCAILFFSCCAYRWKVGAQILQRKKPNQLPEPTR